MGKLRIQEEEWEETGMSGRNVGENQIQEEEWEETGMSGRDVGENEIQEEEWEETGMSGRDVGENQIQEEEWEETGIPQKRIKKKDMRKIMSKAEKRNGYGPEKDAGEEAERAGGQEESREMPAGEKKYRLTGSLAAKIISFFLLGGSCFLGLAAAVLCIYMGYQGFYSGSLEEVQTDMLRGMSVGKVFDAAHALARGDVKAAEETCRDTNMDIEMIREDENGRETVLWGTWDGYETELTMQVRLMLDEWEESVILNRYKLDATETYLFRIYFRPDFPEDDNFRRAAALTAYLYDIKYSMIVLSAVSLLICLILFIFLMCSAGHRNGRKGIVPGPLTTIHLDVLTFLFGGVAAVFGRIWINLFDFSDEMACMAGLTLGGTLLAIWLTIYCMEFALRVKSGKCWKYSLCYILLKKLWHMVCFLGRGLAAAIRAIPLIPATLIAYFGLCIMEFMGVVWYVRESEGFWLWAFEKVILLAVVMYIALTCRKLLNASRALAQGRGDYVVNTAGMPGDFKEHGENLNSLGQGISRAVAERMKSERLKTELISNVSHDLKTPLTSIINYADLIYEETGKGELTEGQGSNGLDYAKVGEYAEVLLRQSRRLKKLLEDLMEASKATTGNLEVLLEPCEVGVLLSQAVGEYQQRMEEKGLELIARLPEKEVEIMADGRRLWRVFDNLLNNICKYAQERSRVYLSVETAGEHVRIIFRNMSKFPLDISPDELEERFVRGDKSRHMEGNGLGLSIAKSLVELQNGRMKIVTDGDLFKVTLEFPVSRP